jgi:hypothetical protein
MVERSLVLILFLGAAPEIERAALDRQDNDRR